MYKIYAILFAVMLACVGCEWRLRNDLKISAEDTFVERYDKSEAFFLTTGDFSAMQHMQTQYPLQTRRLIEDVLQLGKMEETFIKTRFYEYFQDTTLQMLIAEVDRQYADMDDVDSQLADAFERLEELVPGAKVPAVYTQIGSLDQSICVGDGVVGISLDKYLGEDYPLYVKYGYTEKQRKTMVRDFIVPDCLAFYLVSLYPPEEQVTRSEGGPRFDHMGRIQYVVNQVLGREVFSNPYVEKARQDKEERQLTYDALLEETAN